MTSNAPSRPATLALILASTAFLGPVALATLAEIVMKSSNPDDVDITQPLAYLRPLLIFGFSLFGAWVIATIIVILRQRTTLGVDATRPAIVVLGSQLVLGVAILVLTNIRDGIIAA